jgi:hypothetical protein
MHGANIPKQLDQDSRNGTGPNDISAPDALQPTPEKVHLRGLDNLTTKDIRAFASEYFAAYKPANIEWIDDTSANLVYDSSEIAQEALLAFAAIEISDALPITGRQFSQQKAL